MRQKGRPKETVGLTIAMVPTSRLSTPIRASALCVFATIVSIAIAAAEPLGSIPNPRTRDGTWVTDVPRALDAATVTQLNAMIDELERTTGAELAVVVVASLDGQSVEEFAEKLFKLWGIGKAGKDNGLLLLWSKGDRRVRIEVGYGLEGTIPDGKAGAILDTYVIPKFKAGQFDEGIIAGVAAVVMALGNEPVALPAVGTESYEEEEDFSFTNPPGHDGQARRDRRRCALEPTADGRGTDRQRRLRRVEMPVVLAPLHAALREVADQLWQVPAVPQSHQVVH
jgi:hypothetical protein